MDPHFQVPNGQLFSHLRRATLAGHGVRPDRMHDRPAGAHVGKFEEADACFCAPALPLGLAHFDELSPSLHVVRHTVLLIAYCSRPAPIASAVF